MMNIRKKTTVYLASNETRKCSTQKVCSYIYTAIYQAKVEKGFCASNTNTILIA